MKPITLVLPYYDNPGMLRVHLAAWAVFPADLRARLHVILVDDGSPTIPASCVLSPVPGLGSLRLYRITVDVRWNWIAARNLGVHHAETEWLLLTDIDHRLPEETLRSLVESEHDPETVYRLSRRDAPAITPYKPHPNTWYLTKAMFDRVGGYDERFSGYYGTDADFRERIKAAAREVVMLDDYLVRYPRTVVPDASTTTYGRKEAADRETVPMIRRKRAKKSGWRPLSLTFPWQRVL